MVSNLDYLKKAVVNSFSISLINYIVYFFNILIQILLVRMLVPEDYSLYLVAISIVEIASIIIFPDMSLSCIYYQKKEKVFHSSFFLSIFFFFIAIIISIIFIYNLRNYFSEEVIFMVIVLIIFKYLYKVFSIYAVYIEKDINFIKLALYKAGSKIIALIAGVIFAYYGFKHISLVAIEVFYLFLVSISFYKISTLRINFYNFDKSLVFPILKYSFKMMHNRLLEILLFRSPNLIINAISTNNSIIGLFDRSMYVAGMPSTIMAPFHSKVALVLFGRIRDNKDDLIKSLEWSLWFIIRLVTPLSIIIYMNTYEVVNIVFGKNWLQMVDILKPLSLYMIVFLLFNIVKQVFFSLNKIEIVTLSQYYTLSIISITFLYIYFFEEKWSILGYAFSLAFLFNLCYLFIKLSKEYNINYKFIFFSPLLFMFTILLFKISSILWILVLYSLFLLLFEHKIFSNIISIIRKKVE